VIRRVGERESVRIDGRTDVIASGVGEHGLRDGAEEAMKTIRLQGPLVALRNSTQPAISAAALVDNI
jgi:hypothetical protein